MTQNHRGILVSLEQFAQAIYRLANLTGEADREGVERLLLRADEELTEGVLLSSSIAALRWKLSIGFNPLEEQRRGKILRIFEHNRLDSRGRVFDGLAINAMEVSPGLYLMMIDDNVHLSGRGLYDLEITIAQALGIERVLMGAAVCFPVETLGLGRFRLNITPYIDGLRRINIGPIANTADKMIRKVIIRHMLESLGCNGGSKVIPTVFFEYPSHPGIIIEMSLYGAEPASCAHTFDWFAGSVITGTIASEYQTSDTPEPALRLSVGRRASDGESVWPIPTTPELQTSICDLAEAIAGMIER